MWVSRHLPIADANNFIRTDVDAAWFFDGRQFHEKKPMDYVRFVAVHSGGFCHSGMHPGPSSSLFSGGRHEIGIANFAELQPAGQICIEIIFGGLNGRGTLYSRAETGFVAEANVWIS